VARKCVAPSLWYKHADMMKIIRRRCNERWWSSSHASSTFRLSPAMPFLYRMCRPSKVRLFPASLLLSTHEFSARLFFPMSTDCGASGVWSVEFAMLLKPLVYIITTRDYLFMARQWFYYTAKGIGLGNPNKPSRLPGPPHSSDESVIGTAEGNLVR
jgi:hypothetical protein